MTCRAEAFKNLDSSLRKVLDSWSSPSRGVSCEENCAKCLTLVFPWCEERGLIRDRQQTKTAEKLTMVCTEEQHHRNVHVDNSLTALHILQREYSNQRRKVCLVQIVGLFLDVM